MNSPSISRPAPPRCNSFIYKGIEYRQDSQSWEYDGDQEGGYLVAIDPETNARLWMMKVYQVDDYSGQGLPRIGRYFREIRFSGREDILEIECEFGFTYAVDLIKREANMMNKVRQ